VPHPHPFEGGGLDKTQPIPQQRVKLTAPSRPHRHPIPPLKNPQIPIDNPVTTWYTPPCRPTSHSNHPAPLVPRTPASPTFSTHYTLPFLEYFQPVDSSPLAHSFKIPGGIPQFVPFRSSPSPKPLNAAEPHREHDDKQHQLMALHPHAAFYQPDRTLNSHFARDLSPSRPDSHIRQPRFTTHSQSSRDHMETTRIEP
jgi:hypothetical protein